MSEQPEDKKEETLPEADALLDLISSLQLTVGTTIMETITNPEGLRFIFGNKEPDSQVPLASFAISLVARLEVVKIMTLHTLMCQAKEDGFPQQFLEFINKTARNTTIALVLLNGINTEEDLKKLYTEEELAAGFEIYRSQRDQPVTETVSVAEASRQLSEIITKIKSQKAESLDH